MAKKTREVKKQHYVSKFYLSNFSNNQGQLHVFDKQSGRNYVNNIKDVGSQKSFYDVPEFKKEKQIVEMYFGSIESTVANSISNVLDFANSGSFQKLSEDDRVNLSGFVAIQFVRTPEARISAIETYLKVQEESFRIYLKKKYPELENADFEISLDDKKHPLFHALYLMNPLLIGEIASIVVCHIWILLLNKTSRDFYTSDNPMVLSRRSVTNPRGLGLGSKDVEIFLPLSSKVGLLMLARESYSVFEPADGGILIVKDEERVRQLNALQVYGSTQRIYCKTGDFDLARQIHSVNPDVINPMRNRVQVRVLEGNKGLNEEKESLIYFKTRW